MFTEHKSLYIGLTKNRNAWKLKVDQYSSNLIKWGKIQNHTYAEVVWRGEGVWNVNWCKISRKEGQVAFIHLLHYMDSSLNKIHINEMKWKLPLLARGG